MVIFHSYVSPFTRPGRSSTFPMVALGDEFFAPAEFTESTCLSFFGQDQVPCLAPGNIANWKMAEIVDLP